MTALVTAAEAQALLDAREAKGTWRVGNLEAEGKVWAHDPTALGGPSVGEVCLFNANLYRPHNGNRALAAAAPSLAATVAAQADEIASLSRDAEEFDRIVCERDEAQADNATLRAELDDLRRRLSRTANRLADLERTSAALTHDAVLSAIRRGPVVSVCATCHEERTRWCAGCGLCEATCCACPSDEGSAT